MEIDQTGDGDSDMGQCPLCEDPKTCELVKLTKNESEVIHLRHQSRAGKLCSRHHDDNFKFYKMRQKFCKNSEQHRNNVKGNDILTLSWQGGAIGWPPQLL